MKSVSCSTYIFVFFEYSNSMWGLPARSVRRTRTRRQAPFGVQGGAPTMRMRDKVALVTGAGSGIRSEEHTSELQSRPHLVCRLLLEKKKKVDRDDAPELTREAQCASNYNV